MNDNIVKKLIDKTGFNIIRFLILAVLIILPVICREGNVISICVSFLFTALLCCYMSDHSYDKKLHFFIKWVIIFGVFILLISLVSSYLTNRVLNVGVKVQSTNIEDTVLLENTVNSFQRYIESLFKVNADMVVALWHIKLLLLILLRLLFRLKFKNKAFSFGFGCMLYFSLLLVLYSFVRDILEAFHLSTNVDIIQNEDGTINIYNQNMIVRNGRINEIISNWIFIALILLLLLEIGSFFIITKRSREEYKEIKDKYYKANNSIIVCTLQDVFNNRQVNLSWLRIYQKYTNLRGTMIEDGSFRLDEYLVKSYRTFKLNDKASQFKNGDILYFSYNSVQAIFLSRKEIYEIIGFLKEMEKEGFMVHVNENGLLTTSLGRIFQSSDFLYTRTSGRRLNKLGDRRTYIYSCATKEILYELGKLIEEIGSGYIKECLINEYRQMIKSFNAVGCFYHLMAIAQFCIFTRGFDKWTKEDKMPIKNQREVTFGVMRILQNTDIKCDNEDICRAYYILDNIRKNKNMDIKSMLNIMRSKQFNVKYDDITELVVNLRNTFLGHGVMTYMVDAELVFYLLNCVLYILNVFIEDSGDIDTESIITIKKDEHNDADELVPIYHKAADKTYVYSKKLHNKNRNVNNNNAVYLDYLTGEIKCLDISEGMKEIRYDIEGVL